MKEKNILTILADNPTLMEAVKAVLSKQFALPKEADPLADDALLGQKVRAHMAGIQAIENAFTEIAQYRSNVERPDRTNPGR